jgi:hypothetical protein
MNKEEFNLSRISFAIGFILGCIFYNILGVLL